jgi:hypothetical protein
VFFVFVWNVIPCQPFPVTDNSHNRRRHPVTRHCRGTLLAFAYTQFPVRLARDRSPPVWLWNVTVTIPGPPFGDAKSIDDAKARFKAAWIAFKDKAGPEKLAKAYEAMNVANRPDRYQR